MASKLECMSPTQLWFGKGGDLKQWTTTVHAHVHAYCVPLELVPQFKGWGGPLVCLVKKPPHHDSNTPCKYSA